jgi:hypothetical protein
VCCCGCAFLKWKSKSSRWFGKGATSSIVTADVDIPDKVLRSGSIWQKCERRGRKGISVAGLSGHQEQEQEQEQEQRDEVGEAYRRMVLGLLLVLAISSQGFGRVECREFARTVGDNEVVLFLSVFGLGGVECHGSVRGSVQDFRAPVRRAERRTFSYPLLKNGLLCWKSAA